MPVGAAPVFSKLANAHSAFKIQNFSPSLLLSRFSFQLSTFRFSSASSPHNLRSPGNVEMRGLAPVRSQESHRKNERERRTSNIQHRTPNSRGERNRLKAFLALLDFLRFNVGSSMFNVRIFLQFGEALDVRRWMFDVRISSSPPITSNA